MSRSIARALLVSLVLACVLAFGVAAALGAESPAVTTEAATAVKGNKATLNATVNPKGLATTYWFEYGETTSYENKVPVTPASAGSGTTAIAVSQTPVELTAGTIYHFRVAATNSSGTSYGSDRTLTTVAPPTVETEAASAVKATEATLNGSVDPEGGPTTYWFEYGTTLSYGTKVPTTPASAGSGTVAVAVNQALTGLTTGGTYHFRLVATNEAGTTWGSDQTLTTTGTPLATTTAASGVQANYATLNATVNPRGLATTYFFEYGTTTEYGSKIPAAAASVGSGTTAVAVSQTPNKLLPHTTYYFRVVATNEAGTTDGAQRSLTTSDESGVPAQLSLLPVTEPFNGSESSLADFKANFSTLGWATGASAKGSDASTGWRPVEIFPAVAGISYNPVVSGSGRRPAVAVTVAAGPGLTERYISLWLDMSTPGGTTRNGYELHMLCTNASNSTYEATLAKWEAGTRTALGSTTITLAAGDSFAVVDEGSTVVAWESLGSGWQQMLSAADSTWSGGNAGIEGSGNGTLLTNFKAGLLGKAPTVTTEAATEVTGSVATLHGKAAPEGVETTYWFEYGPTIAYGTKEPATPGSIGAGTQVSSISRRQTGLAAGTTYHYRLVATNEIGTTYGSDQTFTTLKPPAASTAAATAVSGTGATLHGSVNPEGLATTYTFEYGTTVSYGSRSPSPVVSAGSGTTAVGESQALTGLASGTTYHYRLEATSAAGTTYGSDQTFTTGSSGLTYQSSFGTAGSGGGQFSHPAGSALDAAGDLWVVDEGNRRVEKFNENGEYLTSFGTSGKGNGQFTRPTDVAIDAKGDLWVTDAGADRVEEFNSSGTYLAQFGTAGTGNGQLNEPEGIAIDAKGNIWVADTYHGRLQEFNEKGEFVKVVGSYGTGAGQMLEPTGVAIGPGGNVWVADWGGDHIDEFNESGTYVRRFGVEGTGNAQFKGPDVVTVDSKGEVWVGDQNNERIQGFTETGEFLTSFGTGGTGNGQFAFGWPMGLSVDTQGNMWVSDTGNDRVQKLRISHYVPTYSSSFGALGSGAGQFSHPAGSAFDSAGNLWVVDEGNDRVEKFNEKGEYLSSFGSVGTGNGQLSRPTDVAIDAKGDLWVTDAGNSRVEEFSSSGTYLSQFGTYGTGNGQLYAAETLAIDASGNIWVGDTYNGRLEEFNEKGEFVKIVGSRGTGAGQMIEPTGIDIGPGGNVWVADWGADRVDEFSEAGTFIRSFGKEGTGKGQFRNPDVIDVDANGDVWVGDQNNERVQEFNPLGEYVTQFGSAGSGAGQFSFSWPMGLTVDGHGNLWVSDTGNDRVQEWTP